MRMMPETDLPDSDDAAPELPQRPSRSARKRSAEAKQKLGERLVALRASQLAALALDLPEALLEAIETARRIKSRGALARQRQYIGRLMRDVDPDPIEKALDTLAHR
jgi:ribosome-associated protein